MVWEIRSAGLVCCRTNQGSCLGKDSIREKVACVTHDSFFILLWVPFLIRFVRWMSRLQELLCNWHEHLLGCSALSSAALPMVNINNQCPQIYMLAQWKLYYYYYSLSTRGCSLLVLMFPLLAAYERSMAGAFGALKVPRKILPDLYSFCACHWGLTYMHT